MDKVAERAKKIGKLSKEMSKALEKKYKPELEAAAKKMQSIVGKNKLPEEVAKELFPYLLKFGEAAQGIGKALGLDEKEDKPDAKKGEEKKADDK